MGVALVARAVNLSYIPEEMVGKGHILRHLCLPSLLLLVVSKAYCKQQRPRNEATPTEHT